MAATMTQPVIHQEDQKLAAWVWALMAVLWVSVIAPIWAVWHEWSASAPADRNSGELIAVLIGPIVLALIHGLLGGIRITVMEDEVTVELRYWPIPVRIPVSTINACRPVTYKPMRQFGGWGVRRSGRTRAYTARGNRGLLLYLDSDRRALLGSDNPEALAAVLSRVGTRVLEPGEDVEAPLE